MAARKDVVAMVRTPFATASLAVFVFITQAFVGAPPAVTAEVARPNILIILADDLGYSDLGCYGGEIPTRNLDRLAAGGLRFSSFCTSARCCPSRASLMTGLHPHRAGIGSFVRPRPDPKRGPAYLGHLNDSCVTLAEILKAAGYSTWMVGKWHMGIPGPIKRGFENYYGFRNLLAYSADQWDPAQYARLPEGRAAELSVAADSFYATDAFSDYALEFIRQARRQEGKPWFLYLAYSSPHFPIQAPKASIDRHVATYRKGWDVLRAERFARMKTLGLIPAEVELPPREVVPVDRDDIANGYSGQRNPAWDSLPADRREDLARRMATFAAMVEHVDQGVGRIVADLERAGEFDNTLILFLSDNGACYEWGPFGFDGRSRAGTTILHTGAELERMGQPGTHSSYGSAWANLGSTPLRLYKHFCHEGGLRSPLIVHWPAGVKQRGAWSDEPAHLMDIVPTVCDVTGAVYPERFRGKPIHPADGISLRPIFRGGHIPADRTLAFEHQAARGLREGRWKLAWGKRMPTPPTWELYDILADPCEQHNLAAEKPELTQQMADEWFSWAESVGVYLPDRKSDH
jgi:arylsulfatase A-like enzyme